MTATLTDSVPRFIANGIQDLSIRQAPVIPDEIPTHLPHCLIVASQGSDIPQLVSGADLLAEYGSDSFDYRYKYANHQTVLVNTLNAAANAMIVQRLIPADAAKPMIRLSVELVASSSIPQYIRDADTGQFILDQAGNKQPLLSNGCGNQPITTSGFIVVWHANLITGADPTFISGQGGPGVLAGLKPDGTSDIGTGATTTNVYPRNGGSASTIYPIVDIPVSDYGSKGNLTGIRLSAPNALSSTPSDIGLAKNLKQYLYRFQAIQRPANQTTANVVLSKSGAGSQDLTFAASSINPSNDQQLAVGKVFAKSFQDLTPTSGPQDMGPFSSVYVYNANVAEVQGLLFDAEAGYLANSNDAWLPIDYLDASDAGLMNLLAPTDFNGVPYATIQSGAAGDSNEVTFDSSLIGAVYAVGGADGDVSVQNFDLMAQNVFNTYGTGPNHFMDDAMWPQSIIYDSGYSMDTKKAMMTVLGVRKDMALVLTTYEDGRLVTNNNVTTWVPTTLQLSESEEQSNAMALNTYASSYPESELYGTSTCRVLITGHSGYLINSAYERLLPLSLDVAAKYASYMGAGAGKWKNGQAPDLPPNNRVTLFYGVNNTWKPAAAYSTDWGLGLNWVQNNNRKQQFWPAFKSVYNDSTSVLNSWVVVLGCVQLEKIAMASWRWCVGIEGLTEAQFVKRSNEFIIKAAAGVFDNRFIVIPETLITPGDELLGYRWTCRIHIYANTMKLVGSFTVVAHRQSDLAASAPTNGVVTG